MSIQATRKGMELRALVAESKRTVAIELIQGLNQANSTLAAQSNGRRSAFQGIYNIEATPCYPSNFTQGRGLDTVQVPTHGIGLDKSYWNNASGYSYVDAAAAAGYATFAYSRSGVMNLDLSV
ncbi:hypothetical protein N7G274_009258 [Stereocaulon virgatum]|uniref:Uncharacterized protein n=1 Tax=Stereocaulon virgatum TaxID=373712 RepID=A0ABR3ZXF0_9LECA